MVDAAALAAVEGLVAFLARVVLERVPRLRPPPGVLLPPVDFLLFVPEVEGLGAAGFLGPNFCVAALVQAATAFVRAAVDSSHLSWADGFAVGPTCALKSSMSENRPAEATSDCRIRNFASGDCNKKEIFELNCILFQIFQFCQP